MSRSAHPHSGRARCGRAREGQATIEFALVGGLFLLGLLGTIDVGLWSLEQMAAVSAVETGARIAASASGSASNTVSAVSAVYPAVYPTLERSFIGTPIQQLNPGGGGCPTDPHQLADQSAVVFVCASPVAGNKVQVVVIGHARSMVPPSFGLGGPAGVIPIEADAVIDTLTFHA